jgi:hypothetical protein
MSRPPLAMTWLRPHPNVRHSPGVEYATDGTHVYDRFRDAAGTYHYCRARSEDVATDAP